jgi:DNA-binding transcriptional ArsR family regulator
MMIRMDNLEIRIVRLLKEWYPITVEELRDELSVRPDTLTRALKSLAVKGVIALEPLTDKTYIRLLMPEIDLEGQKKRGSQGSRADHPSKDRGDDDSFVYF